MPGQVLLGFHKRWVALNKLKRAAAEVLRGDPEKSADAPYFKASAAKKKRPQNLSQCVKMNKPLGERKAGTKLSKKRGYGL